MADGERRRDLVVVGASAGGVGTLRLLVAGLPRDLPAALCIVLHTAPRGSSALASILQRAGRLKCRAAHDGDELEPGRILVAPPDRHLVIDGRNVRLTLGPRENGHRPSVDTLFRSAAKAGDGRVIGVVLSGARDDGTAGLAMIKSHGGGAIVQDPDDALYAGMPASALAHVAVDAVVPAERLATAVADMVNGLTPPKPLPPHPPSSSNENPKGPLENTGVATVCPECGGVLEERSEAGMTQWRCRVGHRYSPESLTDAQAEGVEAALWAAARVLEDRVGLLSRIAHRAETRGEIRSARTFRRRAESAGSQAQLVREALSQAAPATLVGGEESARDEETAA